MWWMLLAANAPIYLNCTLNQEGRTLPVEVVVNEAEQQAIVSLPSGRVVTKPALFSPAEVKIADDMMTWTIDRTSLSFRRDNKSGDLAWSEAGTCQMKPVPAKRAF